MAERAGNQSIPDVATAEDNENAEQCDADEVDECEAEEAEKLDDGDGDQQESRKDSWWDPLTVAAYSYNGYV